MKRDFDFKSVGRKMPYSAPEGYFEQLTQQTMRNIRLIDGQRKIGVNRVGHRLAWGVSLAAAASIIGVMIVLHSPIENGSYVLSKPMVVAESDGENIDKLLSELSDEQIAELANAANNDSFEF